MTRLVLAVLALAAFGAVDAQAGELIRARRQHARIRQGVRSGAITPEERNALRAEQRKIAQDRHDAVASGHVTLEGAAKIRAERNKASRDIFRAKHNQNVQ